MSTRGERQDPLPEQLKELVQLVKSVEARLEECAVVWQSTVSKKQWRIVESSSTDPWERSILARTYFSDKSLDDAFQSLLTKETSFTEQLNYFIALLRGEETSMEIVPVARDAENQCPDFDENETLRNENQIPKQRKNRNSLSAPFVISTIQRSFADLVKAKIDLDTKFLGFEAILNSTSKPTTVQPSTSTSCLCQICSNVLGKALENEKMLSSVAASAGKQKFQRVTKGKQKRLQRSTRTLPRRKVQNRGRSRETRHVDDEILITPIPKLSAHHPSQPDS